MKHGIGTLAVDVFDLGIGLDVLAGVNLAADEDGLKGWRGSDFASTPEAGDEGLHITEVGEPVGIDDRVILGICRVDRNGAAAEGGMKLTGLFKRSSKFSNSQESSPVIFAHFSYAVSGTRWYHMKFPALGSPRV